VFHRPTPLLYNQPTINSHHRLLQLGQKDPTKTTQLTTNKDRKNTTTCHTTPISTAWALGAPKCSARGRESIPDVRSHTRVEQIRYGVGRRTLTPKNTNGSRVKNIPSSYTAPGLSPPCPPSLTHRVHTHQRKRKSHLYAFSFRRRIFLGHDILAGARSRSLLLII